MSRSANSLHLDDKGFEAYLRTQRKLTLKEVRASVDPNREHTLRCDYNDYLAEKEANGPRSANRETLCAKKYVTLDQYRDYVDSGLFTRVAKMSKAEKKQQFGSPLVPIYVPLAHGETGQRYEERFLQWLQDAKNITLQDLMSRWNWREERYYRIQFASANATGEVQFSARKPDAKRELFVDDTLSDSVAAPPHKKCKNETEKEMATHSTEPEAEPGSCDPASPAPTVVTPERDDGACTGYNTMAACMACGCKCCLQSGLRLLASQVSAVQREREQSSVTGGGDAITRLVLDKSAVNALTLALPRIRPIVDEQLLENPDPIESKLLAEYDEVNDEIVLNEKVLDTAVARLAALSTWDIQQITAFQDENQDLRELIQGEYGRRNAALARVILYLWRQETSDLHEMIQDPTATDVRFIQRASHHKCAKISSEMAGKYAQMATIETRVDEAMLETSTDTSERVATIAPLGEQLTTVQLAIQDLANQRKREFAMLIYFDARLRVLLQKMLQTVLYEM